MKNILVHVATILILCATSGFVAAEDYGHDEAKSWSKNGMEKTMMMGKHVMSGTVEMVDLQTGWIKLKTAEGDMVVHFPTPSIKDIKNGDIITVSLSFSKGKKMDDEMMDEKMKK
jgi:hypothetical protein